MVNISTRYDKIDGINQKVFMVRGDEAYARTTDVTISLGTYTSNVSGFVQKLTVDVLRDTGSSFITVYDGEDSIMTTNWTGSTTAQTITLPRLSWDVQHDLWVAYHGNSSCLKSKSPTLSVQLANPNLSDTTLTNNSSVISFDSTSNVAVSVKLDRVKGSASLSDKTINFYVDGVFKASATTNSNGVATNNNIGRLTNGIRTITAEFEGDEVLGASTVSYTVNIGYVVTIEEYPSVFVLHGNNPCKVSVKQHDGTPKSGASVTFVGHTKTTDSNGIASFIITHEMVNGWDYYAKYGNYNSETIRANVVTITGLTISKSRDVVSPSLTNTLEISLTGSNIQSNIPITLTGDLEETIYTNATGNVKTVYNGNGIGDVSITVICGDGSSTVTFEDLIQYWNTTTGDDMRNIAVSEGSFAKLTNGYKFTVSQGSLMACKFDYDISLTDFELSFKVGSGSGWDTKYNYSSVLYLGCEDDMGNIIGMAGAISPFNKNDVIKLVRSSNNLELYKNNSLIGNATISGTPNVAMFRYGTNSPSGGQLTIDNLKLKRIG